MSEKTIAIIGAGVAGLAAGCYGQMNGYKTQVFESHNLPGGLCTAWTRQGYTFDGCIHWLTGSAPGDSMFSLWEELGAVQGKTMYDHDVFWRTVATDGRTFSLYADPDRLEAHMKALSPTDSEPIEQLCKWIRQFATFSMPVGKPRELMSALDGLKLAFRLRRHLKALNDLSKTTMGDYAKRFKDPLLAAGLSEAIGAYTPLIGLVMTLVPMFRKAAGFPAGGSLDFARAIEARYTSLGGEIRYSARVARILERDGNAVGLELEDGTQIDADYVISATDLRATLHSLLDGTRQHETHRMLLQSGKLYPPCVQISFGVKRVIHELDECLGESFPLVRPVKLAGDDVGWMTVKSYAFDPSLAPEGCSVVTSILTADWEFWNRLREDRPTYTAEKDTIAAACANAIDARYPGFKDAIEVTDVATPLTFERYTGNWKGTFMTWLLAPDFQRKYGYVRKTIPGLDNVYLASMWTVPPGGLPGAAMAGREVVQMLCAKDGNRFVTTKP
ncbi:MAG: NAD(P)/FAD-dependent oxidoreductase [Candidatus Atribacteria bacterium]|nr:MAG: NAD(P)/FAD-dependent oxidoreductase [Candidatus Atribacteria bacterium]